VHEAVPDLPGLPFRREECLMAPDPQILVG
jgi:hypothetical protein